MVNNIYDACADQYDYSLGAFVGDHFETELDFVVSALDVIGGDLGVSTPPPLLFDVMEMVEMPLSGCAVGAIHFVFFSVVAVASAVLVCFPFGESYCCDL